MTHNGDHPTSRLRVQNVEASDMFQHTRMAIQRVTDARIIPATQCPTPSGQPQGHSWYFREGKPRTFYCMANHRKDLNHG